MRCPLSPDDQLLAAETAVHLCLFALIAHVLFDIFKTHFLGALWADDNSLDAVVCLVIVHLWHWQFHATSVAAFDFAMSTFHAMGFNILMENCFSAPLRTLHLSSSAEIIDVPF